MQPSASSRLVGIALRDLVEVGAGGEGGAVGCGDGDTGGGAEGDYWLATGLVAVFGFFVGVAAFF